MSVPCALAGYTMFFSPETALIAFSALSAFQDGDVQLNLSSQKVKAARAPSSDAFYAAASALHARHSSNSTTHSASTNSSGVSIIDRLW
ncbi:hypothetical protein C8J57DRAFT_1520129 [Mycena rebaudengoi]|nr:hypothetical protein C8J57DRAFT_1520129 [Mycena rebaudengoi]